MKLSKLNKLITLEFKYDPAVVSAVKDIPGARFKRDPLEPYWTIPVRSLDIAIKELSLTPGDLYPDLTEYIPPFKDITAEIKPDRVKIQGNSLDLLIKSLNSLCKVEYPFQNMIITKVLGKLIYHKNNIAVYKFPPGLKQRVADFLHKAGIPLKDHFQAPPPQKYDFKINIQGRPYQEKAVEDIVNKKISRATLVMATGAGKTVLSAMITARLGVNTIFYTYSSDLLEQTVAAYEKLFGCRIGQISSNKFDIQPITAAMVQTVYSCMTRQDEMWELLSGYLDEVDLMFIDEGHMLGADTIYAVAQQTNPYYSYALTATPFREDNKELYIEAAAGMNLEIISEEELIKSGYILPVKVKVVPVQHNKYKGRRYTTIYRNQIVKNSQRHEIICQTANRYKGRKILILVKEVSHGEALARITGATFIHGASKNRKDIIQSFIDGGINILIATSILKQGIDLPDAEVLILAHGGSSQAELLQKIGRVRRPYPGKSFGIVVDFLDYCPNVSKDMLKSQFNRRLALYKKYNFEVLDTPENIPNCRTRY
ncbi:MAG: DEAD/DEAH box helicase [Clostridiaceae bacterium]|nr:DEAD/DEAH box helicase [Clostridiaceae bacterium]